MSEEYDTLSDYEGGAAKGHAPVKQAPPASLAKLVKGGMQQALPVLMMLEEKVEILVRTSRPYVLKAYKLYLEVRAILEPYGIDEIGICLTGFVMMFFGGFFITTVAVNEAIKQGGRDNFIAQLKIIYVEFTKFKEENKEDNEEDLDGNGIADVKEISPNQYAVRKALLALRSTDPEKLSGALQSLYGILLAVLATLQLQFARTISLGASIGDQMNEVMSKFIIPTIDDYIDDEYHKWLPIVGSYLSRFIGITIAFQIQRILSTFQTAIKGARVFTNGLVKLAERNGYSHLTDGYLDEALSAFLSVSGIYLQLFAWSGLPIIVKLLFFPAFTVESILSTFVSAALSVTTVEAV